MKRLISGLSLPILLSTFTIAGPTSNPMVDHGGSESTGLDKSSTSKFRDPDDGWFDLSNFLDNPAGFVPLMIPITEDAVGSGLAVVPIFISPNEPAADGSPIRPNVSALGGFRTENDSEGIFGVHSANWFDGRLQTTIGGLNASINLDFNGLGNKARQYNLETTAFLANARYRLGESNFLAGLGFIYADIFARFNNDLPIGAGNIFSSSSQLAGPKLSLLYDTRDSIFTPSKGSYAEIAATFHEPSFGASSSHQRYDLVAMHYWQLRKNLILGWRGDLNMSRGDAPFYALPFISLRGVPAMLYQGETAASTEAELRWQFWERFSLVAFGGAGLSDTSSGILEGSDSVFTGGTGFRYEIARRHQLHMGVDFGVTSDGDSGVYITFGSAWGRL